MIKIEIEFDKQTADANVRMPYMALVKMFHVVTEKIHPEDLDNDDSFGEIVLAEFIRCLFQVNEELLKESDKCETENAIAEAQKIINLSEQE